VKSNLKKKGINMARYVSLLKFTPQGAKSLKQSPARAAEFRKAAERAGVKVETQLWTAGAYDGILILSGSDESKVLGTIASLAALGNVQTQTLPAFEAKEFAKIAS
jgi:uncharacterized protein with GYD domain